MRCIGTSSLHVFDKKIDKLLKGAKQLKQKVDILEKENIALKKSIYDLCARYAECAYGGRTECLVRHEEKSSWCIRLETKTHL